MKTKVLKFTRDDVRKAYRAFVARGRKNSACQCLMETMGKRIFRDNFEQNSTGFSVFSCLYDNRNKVATVEFRSVTSKIKPTNAYDDNCIEAKSADGLYHTLVKVLGSNKIEFTYDETKVEMS